MRVVKTPFNNPKINPSLLHVSNFGSNKKAAHAIRKVALPTMEGIHFELIQDIVSLEAQGNYTLIHFKNKTKLLVCKTLREMEEMISCFEFVRVHRSFTINLNCLTKYIRGKGGYVIMENGASINVSSGKKQDFIQAIEHYFGYD